MGVSQLLTVLDLGQKKLTGVFPKHPSDPVTTGPLRLVWCPNSGLLQLADTFSLTEMYGDNYGYRSGLNQSMVRHLTRKIAELENSRAWRRATRCWILAPTTRPR